MPVRMWRERGTLAHCWLECGLGQSLWKTVCKCLKKLKIKLPDDPAIPLSGYISKKKSKTLTRKDIVIPVFIAVLFTKAKTWKQPKRPLVDKEEVAHICTTECYSAIQRSKILPLVITWTDLENITLSEVSQTERGKYHVIPLICGI